MTRGTARVHRSLSRRNAIAVALPGLDLEMVYRQGRITGTTRPSVTLLAQIRAENQSTEEIAGLLRSPCSEASRPTNFTRGGIESVTISTVHDVPSPP